MDVYALKTSPIVRGSGLLLLSIGLSWLGFVVRANEWLALAPVTAILFGLLVRFPSLGRAQYWAAIFSGMVVVDLLNGVSMGLSIWFNACQLIQVLSACALLTLRPMAGFYEPRAVLYLFVVAVLSVALGATLATPFSLHETDATAASAWLDWFSEQFSTWMLLAPIVICLPKRLRWPQLEWLDALPLVCVLVMLWIGNYIGGPGALAFVLPALLWCAMRYRMFPLCLLVMLIGLFEIARIPNSFSVSAHLTLADPLCSVRLGVGMMVLSPLLVGAATYSNRRLLSQIQHTANHDYLTGALTRRAFTQQAKRLLLGRIEQKHSVALLLMDIDHFKSINDTFGHATGDQALRGFAERVRTQLRRVDVFGRLGGEEFALLLPGVSHTHAWQIAERVRHAIEAHEFRIKAGVKVKFTVSIGLVYEDGYSLASPLEVLLEQADAALYQAKAQGRNQVQCASMQSVLTDKLKLSMY